MDDILVQPNIDYRGGFDGFDAIDKSTVGCLLYTSGYDGTPNLLLEAMACGLPCVCSAVGGIPDLMAEGRGLLIDPDAGADAYVAAIEGLLRDPLARERMAQLGREHIAGAHSVEKFDQGVARLLAAL
jgi:glycosyltransferase involved in cell wall biosynthesis